MGDMGEYWKDVKEIRHEKRWSNYDHSKKMLEDNKVRFTEKPNGHFIIFDSNNKAIFDFWATTGLFINRKSKRRGRGIKNLLRLVRNHGSSHFETKCELK